MAGLSLHPWELSMSDPIYVSSTEELYEVLATCTGGETILLEPGEYGDLTLNSNSGFDITFADTVTIASADPDDPAVFSTMKCHGGENITFDGIYFDYTFTEGDDSWYRPFEINDSTNIEVVNCTFDGDVAEGVGEIEDGYGWAYGLSVRSCEGVTVENSEFFGFQTGMIVSESNNVNVTGNDVHSMRLDGMNFAEVTNVTIVDNYIHDFAANMESDDHCDMLQFWTNGTDSPSTNIVIENNVLDVGDGTPAQSIFMRNEEVDTGQAGEEMYYQNVTISNNVIVNATSAGISVGETDGLLIENNTVVHADGGNDDGIDGAVEIPVIYVNEDSTDVTITQNISNEIRGDVGQSDWTVSGNVLVQDQDPYGENYYGEVFITSTLAPEDGVHAYVAAPGGVLETVGAGASATLNPEIDGAIEAHFQIASTPDNAAVRHFDASLTLTSLDRLPDGTTYSWDFGDGSTGTGLEISHAFPDGGVYPVTLTVTLPDGTSDSQSFDVGIQGPMLISLEDGQVLAFEEGAASVIGDVSGTGIEIPVSGSGTPIGKEHFTEIGGADDVEISLTIEGNTAHNAGEILRLHMSFYMAVEENGELTVVIHNPDGTQFNFTTSGASLDDTASHDIYVHLSGETLEITVDGNVVGTGEVPGGMGASGEHDLSFGNPWGGENYDGVVTALEVSANGDDFDGTVPPPPVEEQPEEPPIVEEAPVEEEEAAEDEPPAEEPAPEAPPVEEPPAEETPDTDPGDGDEGGNGNGNDNGNGLKLGLLKKLMQMMESMFDLFASFGTSKDASDTESSVLEADKMSSPDESTVIDDSMAA